MEARIAQARLIRIWGYIGRVIHAWPCSQEREVLYRELLCLGAHERMIRIAAIQVRFEGELSPAQVASRILSDTLKKYC